MFQKPLSKPKRQYSIVRHIPVSTVDGSPYLWVDWQTQMRKIKIFFFSKLVVYYLLTFFFPPKRKIWKPLMQRKKCTVIMHSQIWIYFDRNMVNSLFFTVRQTFISRMRGTLCGSQPCFNTVRSKMSYRINSFPLPTSSLPFLFPRP